MGSGHAHGTGQAPGRRAHRTRLILALCIALVVLVIEVIGSLVTGSLALLADAGHMVSDVAALAISVVAVTLAARPATPRRTFGYLRMEVLAATFNAALLFAVAAWIAWEAIGRWNSPAEIDGGLMLAFAVVGLAANVAGIWLLRDSSRESVNVKGAYLEMWGDLLGSIAVIVAAVMIALTGWERADTVVSIAVVLIILPRAWSLLRETVDVLLESTPQGIDVEAMRAELSARPHVLGVHDMHCWTITSGLPVVTVHVVVADEALEGSSSLPGVLDELAGVLHERFGIEHSTIQVEPASSPCGLEGLHR